jgi:hypothetical protein
MAQRGDSFMDIGTIFTQVWSTNPIWSTSTPATQATSGDASGSTTQTRGSSQSTFASTLQTLAAELQQFQAGTQGSSANAATSGTSSASGTASGSGTAASGTSAQPGTGTSSTDTGDQLAQFAGGLTNDVLFAAQLYAGPAALFL